MSYEIISKKLIKKGFKLNEYGSPELDTKNINIRFIKNSLYYVISYTKKNIDKRTIYAPSEIKLPLKCTDENVFFVIESLKEGVDEQIIVMDVLTRLDSNNSNLDSSMKDKPEIKNSDKFSHKIITCFGTISETTRGWKKELNLISWNGREPKYDLRDWAFDHEKMGKGVTLTIEELKKFRAILNKMEL